MPIRKKLTSYSMAIMLMVCSAVSVRAAEEAEISSPFWGQSDYWAKNISIIVKETLKIDDSSELLDPALHFDEKDLMDTGDYTDGTVHTKDSVDTIASVEAVRLQGVPIGDQTDGWPTGCELFALWSAAVYSGVEFGDDPIQEIWDITPHGGGNPNVKFVGNPKDSSGITMFPPVVLEVAQKLGLTGEIITSVDQIKEHLIRGHSIVVTLGLDLRAKTYALQKIRYGNLHTVTLTGFDHNYFYFNDSLTVKEERMDIGEFTARFRNLGGKATAIWLDRPEPIPDSEVRAPASMGRPAVIDTPAKTAAP